MPETIGLAILTAVQAAGVAGPAGFALTSTTIAGVGLTTIVGSAAIIGVSIGLQYALNNAEVPKPEDGVQSLKQALAPRRRGYWINRLGGVYMLYLAAGGASQDMLAFHSGRIQEFLSVYLHDNQVSTVPDPAHGVVIEVQSVGAETYLDSISLQLFDGRDDQTTFSMLNASTTSGVWTSAHAGQGIACGAMICALAADPETHTKRYPQGLPVLSVVAKCALIWDPRDGAQTRANRDSWKASPNPVLQLIDYITEPDGGMGEAFEEIFTAEMLAQWMVEADHCINRYDSAGWYQFDNAPENVIGKILAACDGWMAEDGEGNLVLNVGFYREPTDPPITEADIVGWRVRIGSSDEDSINRLDVSFTDPSLGYVTNQIDSVRDEAAISLAGIERSKPLDLSWVQDADQASRLGRRAMLRLNSPISGTLTMTLYGARYLGKRWVKLQLPHIAGLEDCVIEIQDKSVCDILGDRVTLNFILVDPEALLALQ
jgi:hypothetical protein